MNDIKKINLEIDKIDKIENDHWLNNLEDRKLKELEFHNRDRNKEFVNESKTSQDTYEKFYGNKKYYSVTKRSFDYVDNWIKENANGKVFLDYACGNGINAMKASADGAALSLGFDISDVSVKNAREDAINQNLSDIRFFQADAENTLLPDNSIDSIICCGMLHHLDLSYAFPELRRILKPGGKILAVEALDYNPLIKLYRYLTPDMRTEWEKAHILSLKDLKFASHFLTVQNVNYWHVIGYIGGKFKRLKTITEAADKMLEKIPFVQKMAWIFTFELSKPIE
ncbi:class I SAM-dependent methyltransferase [Verrucomicrobiales bacterium]|nr:class I SAM-dependent methyltransferase [Verrucomicrobiales bacterium]